MTIKKHASFEEADKFEHKDAYQTLYREGPDYPVHVHKNHRVKKYKVFIFVCETGHLLIFEFIY